MKQGTWSTLHRHHIGMDIDGTTIKYAVVDTANGTPTTPVLQLPIPQPATPQAVAEVLGVLVSQLSSRPQAPSSAASVGVTLPAIIRSGVARSAAHIDDAWIGLDVNRFLTERLGRPVHVLNDADAAGAAELRYGAGRRETGRPAPGTVLVIILSTGIGSALFLDGKLVPNLELGHLELNGLTAETRASIGALHREGKDWQSYAEYLHRYFSHLQFLFSPNLMIVGGGLSTHANELLPHLQMESVVVPAQLPHTAGVIGAARHAYLAIPPRE